MSRKLVACLVMLALSATCYAHWTEHPELPDWAQRGRLHWCLHYARADREKVDLFLDGGQTFVHGGSFDSEETAEYAREQGLRYMPYVCSRTLTIREIEQNPQLKDAVVLKADGTEFLAYNNPVRRYGSLYVPAWPEYVRERTRKVWDRPDVAAIFFDNAFWPGDDHRPETIRAWQQWARAHGLDPGDDVPSIRDGPLAAASRAFSFESLINYHAGLREFCHQHNPPLLNCPNGGLAGAEAGAVDLVFYETMTHPPFVNNAFRYKVGLAASHGKPTGMLAYLPPNIAAQRGERTWNEGMHHFFYPSSPIAEEFSLAAAEGAACGGTYIPNYSLFPSLPITDTTDPFCKRIHRALKQSYTFLRTNEDLYAEAQPGSNVAVLYARATDLQNRRLQNVQQLSEALTAAGIPYEVVVASDLTRDGMAGIRTLVLPNVLYLDKATAEGILAFARAGGRVIVTGDYALYDTIGQPAHPQAAQKLLEPLHLISRAIRDWDLDGFEPEGPSHVCVSKDVGKASLKFDGPAGRYLAHICIDDENDGTSAFSLAVGDKAVYEGLLDAEDNQLHWHTTPAFDLKPGDVVTLTVHADGGERGRVHSVVLVGAQAGEGASLGKGQVLYSPIGLEQLPAARRLALLRPALHLPNPGKLFVNVMDVPGRDLQTVHLVNYDFRYEVTIPGLYASDDGSSEARMFFGGESVAVRKRIIISDLDQVTEPVVQVRGFATTDCTARLLVSINGQRTATIEAKDAHGHGWIEAPVNRDLLKEDNLIEVRAEGELDGMQRWIQIDIDTDTNQGNSSFSTDGGKTFSTDDLSTDLKAQTGEYMIRILDKAPGEVDRDPTNLVRNPGYERTKVPHSETKLRVVPAENVKVEMAGTKPRQCLLISPDGPPQWIKGTTDDNGASYVAPRVDIYSVLLLASSRAALEPLRQAQMQAAPWDLPPITEPLREVIIGWQHFGDGFVGETDQPHSGKRCIRCENGEDTQIRGAMQQFDFEERRQPAALTITAWSRCEEVSGARDAHYSVYVDAVCADGTVFNGQHTSFEVGTHGWQQVTLRLEPPSPIRTMKLFLLFRKHSGRAWFDDVRMTAH